MELHGKKKDDWEGQEKRKAIGTERGGVKKVGRNRRETLQCVLTGCNNVSVLEKDAKKQKMRKKRGKENGLGRDGGRQIVGTERGMGTGK